MVESISLQVNLRAFVRREAAARWIAACPQIGVVSQARTRREARKSLQEAVELWFESCIERGVLDQALRESSFRPSTVTERRGGRLRRNVRPEDVLGEAFEIHMTVPGYEALPLLSASA